MKDKFLKMAGVKNEEEFYEMFPTEEAFFQAYPQAREMKKGGNVPTNPSLYSRVKSEAKSKFDRWPSAYGSAWLVKEYKRRGGGYRKAQNGMQMEQMFAYPQYNTEAIGNMQAYYQDAVSAAKDNAFGSATRSFTDAMKVGQAMQPQDKGASGESSGMDPQAIAGIAKLLSGLKMVVRCRSG